MIFRKQTKERRKMRNYCSGNYENLWVRYKVCSCVNNQCLGIIENRFGALYSFCSPCSLHSLIDLGWGDLEFVMWPWWNFHMRRYIIINAYSLATTKKNFFFSKSNNYPSNAVASQEKNVCLAQKFFQIFWRITYGVVHKLAC